MATRKHSARKDDAPAIDPHGEDTVLEYAGPGIVPDIPARDLHGNDLARVAYVRAFQAIDWEKKGAKRPDPATQEELDELVDELVATGNYTRAPQPDDKEG